MTARLKIDIRQPHPDIAMLRVSGTVAGPASTVVAAALEEVEGMGIRTVILNLGDPASVPDDLLEVAEATSVRLESLGGELIVSSDAPDAEFEELWAAEGVEDKPLAV